MKKTAKKKAPTRDLHAARFPGERRKYRAARDQSCSSPASSAAKTGGTSTASGGCGICSI
jgi:hypothetical protein